MKRSREDNKELRERLDIERPRPQIKSLGLDNENTYKHYRADFQDDQVLQSRQVDEGLGFHFKLEHRSKSAENVYTDKCDGYGFNLGKKG